MFDHRLGRVDTQVMQRVGRRFERIHFLRGEFVGGGFVPVRPGFMRMVGQADLLDPLAPVGPGNGWVPLHHELIQYELPVLPNPPRTTSVRCASACCTAPATGDEMFVMLWQATAAHWPP